MKDFIIKVWQKRHPLILDIDKVTASFLKKLKAKNVL
jgi:hypothetical protein